MVNGGFEEPNFGESWSFLKVVKGWVTEEIEIGNGKIYNSAWESQICELDGNKNDVIEQSFEFEEPTIMIDVHPLIDTNNVHYPHYPKITNKETITVLTPAYIGN